LQHLSSRSVPVAVLLPEAEVAPAVLLLAVVQMVRADDGPVMGHEVKSVVHRRAANIRRRL
jgi:hypothetical protein